MAVTALRFCPSVSHAPLHEPAQTRLPRSSGGESANHPEASLPVPPPHRFHPPGLAPQSSLSLTVIPPPKFTDKFKALSQPCFNAPSSPRYSTLLHLTANLLEEISIHFIWTSLGPSIHFVCSFACSLTVTSLFILATTQVNREYLHLTRGFWARGPKVSTPSQ